MAGLLTEPLATTAGLIQGFGIRSKQKPVLAIPYAVIYLLLQNSGSRFLLAVSASLFCAHVARGQYVDVTTSVGIDRMGGKAAVADVDNDGWPDLYGGGRFYRNSGGNFVEQSIAVSGDGGWGDYDKDGHLDFFSYTSGELYRNLGGTNLQMVAQFTGLPTVSRGGSWVDLNNDTFLDFYVGAYEPCFPCSYESDIVFINNADGTFSDATVVPASVQPARGITTADWDEDGDMDVYVSNYRLEPNVLWRNDGNGQLTDASTTHNATATCCGYGGGHSIGATFGDFNNDGHIDLFAGNFAHDANFFGQGNPRQPESRFLRNRGPGFDFVFEDMDNGGIAWQESYASPSAGDVDNDGDLDLFFTVAHGSDQPRLYRNEGNFSFTNITNAWGLSNPFLGNDSYQTAFVDFDDDGDLDLIHNERLYRNTNSNGNHWLKVRLDGNGFLDRSVLGAQLRIDLGGGQILTRQVESAAGEGNQNNISEVHFGLGAHDGPLQVEIRWPDQFSQIVAVANVDQTVDVVRQAFDPDVYQWNQPTGGDWHRALNWNPSNGPPTGDVDIAFGTTIAAPSTVVVDTPATVRSIRFDSSVPYGVAGHGGLTLDQGASALATIEVVAGSHAFQTEVSLVDNAVVTVGPDNSLDFNERIHLNGNTLELDSGRVNINHRASGGGSIINSGVLGTAGLAIIGADLTSTGTLHFDIGGTDTSQFDWLLIAGDAELSGYLDVELAPGFEPASAVTVLTANSLDAANLMLHPSDVDTFRLTTVGNQLVLDLIGNGVPGDYNNDGTVNSADYVVWRNHLGTSTLLPNDSTPGAVDPEDYEVWKSHFGSTSSTATFHVPEPCVLVLLLVIANCVFVCGRGPDFYPLRQS